MIEHQCGWSEWLSPGQPAGTPGICTGCGLNMTYGGVKRCMAKPPSTTTPPVVEQPLKEIDFLFGQLVGCPVGLAEGLVL